MCAAHGDSNHNDGLVFINSAEVTMRRKRRPNQLFNIYFPNPPITKNANHVNKLCLDGVSWQRFWRKLDGRKNSNHKQEYKGVPRHDEAGVKSMGIA
jgi:hypothetical protein